MDISTLSLARAQFVTSLSFLALFLSVALALAWILLFFKLRARMSSNGGWTAAYRFWVRIFALSFVLTLAASVPVLIQLGSLWAGLMDKIGNVAGPLLGYGILSVFILKSCFLGVMLFGQRRVSDGAHTLAVLMVAVGQLVAVFWVLACNRGCRRPTARCWWMAAIRSMTGLPWCSIRRSAGAWRRWRSARPWRPRFSSSA